MKNQKDAAKEAAKKALPGKPIAKAKEKKKQRAAEWDVDAVDLYDAILHPAAPADVLRGLIVLASDDELKTRMKAANKKKRCMLHAAAQMRSARGALRAARGASPRETSRTEARYPSHWSPYDRVGVVNADP